MNTTIGFQSCLAFINSQVKPGEGAASSALGPGRKLAVTISRQTGAGALTTAGKLRSYLEERAPGGNCCWTVFDRNLVEKVLEDHHLPKKLAQFMKEDRVSMIDDTMQELLGLHPPTWDLVRQTTETILQLAELGNVILIGRGATIITAKLEHVFHVRLVGSEERRAQRVEEHYHLDPPAALRFLRQEDEGRRRYIRTHFRADLESPLLYHLVINTDLIPCDQAARLIGDAMLRRFGPPGA